jgi:hypothetical protein
VRSSIETTRVVGEDDEVLRRPVGAHVVRDGVEGVRFSAPHVLTRSVRRERNNGVGHEGTPDARLVLSARPVLQDRGGVLDRRHGVR